MLLNTTVYSSVIEVRPDDIDLFQHVHSSKYMDFVLAARYDQMHRCYKMSFEEFMEHGMGFVIIKTKMHFKRALKMGDKMEINTHIVSLQKNYVIVDFEIINQQTKKVSCDGYFKYSLIDLKTGKALSIPEWVIERFSL